MKNLIVIGLLLISNILLSQSSSDNFSGVWKTEEGKLIKISKAENMFKGMSVSKNKLVIKDLQFIDGMWQGTIQNPENGNSADCEVSFENKTKLKIVARKGWFSKTIYWTRKS